MCCFELAFTDEQLETMALILCLESGFTAKQLQTELGLDALPRVWVHWLPVATMPGTRVLL